MEKILMENESMSPEERDTWRRLAEEIEKMTPRNIHVINKLTDALRREFPKAAKTLCINEFDKFTQYRDTLVPLLIQKLFNDNGSPWGSIEKKMKKDQK